MILFINSSYKVDLSFFSWKIEYSQGELVNVSDCLSRKQTHSIRIFERPRLQLSVWKKDIACIFWNCSPQAIFSYRTNLQNYFDIQIYFIYVWKQTGSKKCLRYASRHFHTIDETFIQTLVKKFLILQSFPTTRFASSDLLKNFRTVLCWQFC